MAGTVGFALWDSGKSINDGEYVGAGIDILSAAAGFGAGVVIDKISSGIKDEYYGR
ncbi:hypothetical protein J2Z44_004132 [Clostridium punense]|uniref:Bacteriocin n=1 Tax=Clostridium punense TaxID=1054297 RepID=A0ABS4KCC7_9CLOT|nr:MULTISPECIES: hypothetical protein [Clostridium]EQB89005.1 hypothetical protein M918_22285 [Clostridium sp. BL8]MBP2024274.1 hypothetical protein [Clostridium punense]